MYAKEHDTFMNGARHALNLPIRQKCAELTVLLDRGNILELHNFFPILINHIFGPQGTICWEIRTITESSSDDFRQMQHFLSPNGPVFKLIYTLLKDPAIKYDFSLTFLPTKIRQFLENSQNHPFYSDLIHINPQTKQVMSLLLNPFDYYMFHFAYHLINPWHQRSGSTVRSWNTIYYVLCCDYILYFLPTDPNATILPNICYNGKSPVQNHQPINNYRIIGTGLINTTVLNKSVDETLHKNLERHPRNEIWRSETVLTVFVDMWLHNDQITQQSNDLNNSLNGSPRMGVLLLNELPTGEYMRIVRVLMKQLHAFSQSSKADDTNLCELKKIAIPMIQGKFYIFLRNLIHKWPLDGSFRLVLELWLTYIQPWRYPPDNLVKQNNMFSLNQDVEDLNQYNSVDTDFLPFIAENLLAYVVIFQQLLPRFTRVDLVSPKMSLMLYRITKVFDQPNLPTYLQEIENCVENNHSPTHHKYNSHWGSNLPPLSPTSNWSSNTALNQLNASADSSRAFQPSVNSTAFLNNSFQNEKKWLAIVRQKIFELEGPNFCYKPLFSNPPAPEVFDLIYQIKKSISVAQDIVKAKQLEEDELSKGLWGSIKSLWTSPCNVDEFSLAERMKVPCFLDVSLQNLMDIFQINEVCDREPDYSQNKPSTSGPIEFTNDFKFLTPEKVRNRIKNIKYDGDPDLLPIRSDENTFLVRTLYQLALKINQQYGSLLYRMYHTHTFSGRLTRQILCPPQTVYKFDKSLPGSPRVSTNLPPRVSFRSLASYKFLIYFTIFAMVCMACGFSFTAYICLLLILFLSFKCMMAIPCTNTPVSHNYPTQGFGNISFNDSF
ncbi:unnamed protein product [Brassicogethes aeneus]|uniref:Sphingomyelin phosphodiesterase 4 n=1 Tax=Brassicogethes aeneus TaxID=1431903 RepID=A0A9P0FIC4_BRAAE|nr:unnamed protein product [Brassicogethes aeneus]